MSIPFIFHLTNVIYLFSKHTGQPMLSLLNHLTILILKVFQKFEQKVTESLKCGKFMDFCHFWCQILLVLINFQFLTNCLNLFKTYSDCKKKSAEKSASFRILYYICYRRKIINIKYFPSLSDDIDRHYSGAILTTT